MIGPEHWHVIEAILDQVLDQEPENRQAFLDGLTLDGEIRAEVEALLHADAAAGDFLEQAAVAHLPSISTTARDLAPAARIGPYRLEEALGRGGMGEVYRAWDQRLDRWVALKRVLWRVGEAREDRPSLVREERFRREARLAAGIDHPAVVRIHDILDADGETWLVMEYLEGKTVAELLDEGPLGEEQTLALAREITGGLAAAHRRGVLHRDLKAQNVLVTPEGRAKILDFGLAKRLDGESGAGPGAADFEPSLTASRQVLGTVGSMSPEQARGEPLDARSDLFSLGVLLYEMTTGERPFEALTVAATLTRVCTHRPAAPKTRNPLLSAATSLLVEELLEKDPASRPDSASEVLARLEEPGHNLRRRIGRGFHGLLGGGRRSRTATLLSLLLVGMLAVGATGWWAGWGPSWWQALRSTVSSAVGAPSPVYVAVAPTSVRSDLPSEAGSLAPFGVYAAVQEALSRLQGLAPIPGDGPESAGLAPAALGRELGAAEVLTSDLDCRARSCQVTLRRLAAADGRVLWLSLLEVPGDNPLVMHTAVASRLREAYPQHEPRAGSPYPEVSENAYRTYLRLLRAFRGNLEPRGDELLDQLAELRRQEEGFLEVYLLEAEVARSTFAVSRRAGLSEHALELLEQAGELGPRDPRVPAYLFDVARESERWELAAEALASLQDLEPGGAAVLLREAELLEHRGEAQRALERMREAATIWPASHHLFNLALMEYRTGEVTAARRTLEGLLQQVPTHARGRAFLAQLELVAGDPQRALELFETAAGTGGDTATDANLGTALLLVGRYRDAEARFRQAFEREPNNAILALGLADALELSGDTMAAGELYLRVLELLEQDPGLQRWQWLTVRAQALAHLGRSGEAVESAQEAWALAPDNPQVAFETALVYTLTGDLNVARSRMARARDLGLGTHWFRFPWFEPLFR